MKILQINVVNKVESTGRSTYEIHEYLLDHDFQSFVASTSDEIDSNTYKIGHKFDYKLHGLLSRIAGKQGYFSKHSTHKLLKYIDRIKPDIVHLRNLHGSYINLKLLLNYLAKNDIATVATLHDSWFYTGRCTYYFSDNCYKWQESCGNCPRLKKDNPSWFFDNSSQMLDDKKTWFSNIPRLAVVGVSDWITNDAKKSILSSANIVKRIYNWIDYNKFKPTDPLALQNKLNLKNKFVILGVASKWVDSKGINDFVELSKKLSQDMQIILVGNGSFDTSKIIHIPETHDIDELVQYYSLADVFLNFSAEETFGKVSAEALSCGTPVIANAFTANPEIVGKACGIILNDFNIDNILKALKEIKLKGKESYSDNCRNHIKNNFDKENLINDYINIYQELYSLNN